MSGLELLALMHVRALSWRWDQPTPDDWADVLTNLPLFTGVNKRRLRKLAGDATFAEFAPGETIVFATDPGGRGRRAPFARVARSSHSTQ